jgi:alkanesulfonate monooxygenase SsuD/methylene tetrahydromethanopterin reductase-like flavin-dependent oxidoreductase (luciferase family)
MSGLHIGVLFDMRNPDRPDRAYEALYAGALDQVAIAEELGYDSVWVTEHHCTDDGYTPSPLPLLAAMSQRSATMRLGTNVLLAPLHHPLQIAEDAATLAVMSGGRFDLGIGAGYSPQEFGAFGVNLRNRPSLMTETVDILRLAWRGEPFSYAGRRYTIDDARVTPVAARPPRILMGGLSAPAAERAARIGDGYMGAWPASLPLYTDALVALGREPTHGAIGGLPLWWVIADDPEREWARVGDHALYQINRYVDWGAFGEGTAHFGHRDELLAAGLWQALDGPAAVAGILDLIDRFPRIEDVHVFNALPGEDLDSGTARMEYVAEQVLPAVRRELAAV